MLKKRQTMKNILLLALTLCPLLILGQESKKPEDCPVFISGTSSKSPELSISLNTIDPFLPLGNIHFEDKYLDGGNYINKSFAIGLTGKYFFNESDGLRLKFIYTDKNISDNRDITSGARNIDEQKFRQTLIKFAPGFQWTFTKYKVSFTGGVELPITFIGKMTNNFYWRNEALDGTLITEVVGVTNIPGGYSTGLGIFLGSNYFFTKHFAVGFEFADAYQYTSVGKINSSTGTETNSSGTTTWTNEVEETIKQYKFSTIQTGINLTIKF